MRKKYNREVQYALDVLDKKITMKDVPQPDQYMVKYHITNVERYNRPRPVLKEEIK
jgi:hypothetical protein